MAECSMLALRLGTHKILSAFQSQEVTKLSSRGEISPLQAACHTIKCDYCQSCCSLSSFIMNQDDILGRCGAMVESMPFDREGRGFESRYVGNLRKSFAYSCLWRFGV